MIGVTATAPRDLLAGVDVGGTSIAVLLADSQLVVRGRYAAPTRRDEPEQAGQQVAAAVHGACRAGGVDPARIAAVGVGVPGRVDSDAGTVSLALNLGWREVDLRDQLEALLGVDCFVANDVRAAARGLVERRVLGGVDDLVYVSVGTGISAGIVIDGHLVLGMHGMAGEIGHVVVRPGGARCICGLRGCLETVASGRGIAARAQEALDAGTASTLVDRRPVTARDVYNASEAGDELARSITEEAGRALGRVTYDLALTFDVERVCFGGGVSQAGSAFIDPIRRELDRLRGASPLAADLLPLDLVQLLPAGTEAGVWGALFLARKGRTGRSVREPDGKEVGGRSQPSPLAT